MDKKIFALYIGHLIISMNEIDWMTIIIKKLILGENPSKTWINKSLSYRLKNLLEDIARKWPHHEKLKMLIKEALDMCEIRNLVAHGSFALDGREPIKEGEKSKLLIHSIKSSSPASQKDIAEATNKCIKLSDDISECIAIIQMESLNSTKRNA